MTEFHAPGGSRRFQLMLPASVILTLKLGAIRAGTSPSQLVGVLVETYLEDLVRKCEKLSADEAVQSKLV